LTFGPRAADGHGTLAASSNYTLSYTGANLTVTARPITVTANSETIPVGAPDPAYTFGVTSGNLVNGDAFSGRLIRVPGETAAGATPF
jgi:large repetitive protein